MRCATPLLALLSVLASTCLPVMAAPDDGWALRFDGIGPLKIGMSFGQADLALGLVLQRTPPAQLPTKGCEQIGVPRHPGVALMFIDDVLERIDVFEPGTPALDNLAVGAPVSQVLSAYPNIDQQEHAYDDGEQYLTLYADKTAPPSPHGLALRLTTYKGKIGAIIAGRLQEVRYIEGCL